ncbi:MAG: hypothetical protein H6706_30640 [Myxococcales bacterium]|nr:hypothetical protein [Myxococcales bacterium]
MNVLIVGPLSAAGEQVLDALAGWATPPRIAGADVEATVGQDFEFRGEAMRVLDVRKLLAAPWDAIVVAAPLADVELPAGPLVVALPGVGLEAGLTLPGVPVERGARLRTPDPLAALVAEVLSALEGATRPTAVEVVALDAASAVGRPGMDELRDQTIELLNFREPPVKVLPQRLAFEVLPRAQEPADPAGAFTRDLAALRPGLAGHIFATRVLVPAFVGLTATLRIELAAPTTAADVQAALARHPALQLGEAPTLADAIGEDVIHVGPPTLRGQVLHLWLAADDTRVGAALLAVRILEGLEASR